MSTSNKLITNYQFRLVEDHHPTGSGRYGVRIILPDDIIASFPYLNTVLDDTLYDHENCILTGLCKLAPLVQQAEALRKVQIR
jgi:hypothetical protein